MEIVGGYRLVRKLGAGPRAEVYLGHAGTATQPRVAALKLYRPDTLEAAIDTEIEALGRACSRHLLALSDLATDTAGRPCLVLERLVPGSLAAILSERDHLLPGEAVTVLAPLALAVAELHRVGVAHGAIRLSNVLFDETGAPVLAGFGSASLVGAFPASARDDSLTAAQLSEEAAVQHDLAGLALVCQTVLEHTHGLDANREAELRDALERPVQDAHRVPHEWAEHLFDLSEPLPLGAPAARSTLFGIRAPDSSVAAALRQPPATLLVARRDRFTTPEPVAPEALSNTRRYGWRLAIRGARLWKRIWTRPRTAREGGAHMRRPILLAGATGVVLLVLGLTLIPDTGSTAPRGRPAAAGAAADPASGWKLSGPVAQALRADDPVAAARALLGERVACLEHRSVPCLRQVDQADSAVLENDQHFVRSGRRAAGSEQLLFPIETATLIERMGDSALVALTLPDGMPRIPPTAAPPAAEPDQQRSLAVLVIRTAQGWRLRDLLTD